MSSIPEIVIVGGGICGLAAALALTEHVSPSPKITIFELRPDPATIGGAINLTPNALRYLDYLGVREIIKQRQFGAEVDKIDLFSIRTGARMGEVDFTNASQGGKGYGNPPYKALRIMRAELMLALLEALLMLKNVELNYGKKTVSIREAPEAVTITFEDGSEVSADLILGCDGIHSAVRRFVDPERTPVYSGIAVAYAFAKIRDGLEVPFRDTSFCSSRQGSFMASHYQPSRQNLYVGAVMEVAEVSSKEGWRAKGADQDVIRRDIKRRLGGGGMPIVDALIEDAGDCFLYPVYRLPPKGHWAMKKVILLGDAAHAMPPQGEGAGMVFEDVILFSRIIGHHGVTGLKGVFTTYEDLRKGRIDAAYDEANFRWETNKDSGWLVQSIKEWLTPVFLWWSAKARKATFEEDLTVIAILTEQPKV